MRPRRYIGITGFTNQFEVDFVTGGIALPVDQREQIMVGVLASSKTIRGIPNKYPRSYPKPENLGAIFMDAPHHLNLIHFNTKDQDWLVSDLTLAQELAGPHCHGFQLNIAWPNIFAVGRYRNMFPGKKIVLQCGGHALDAVGRSGKDIAEMIKRYNDLIDYVLIDPSGGAGQPFDLNFARECFQHLQAIDHIGFGIAGGLHPGNLHQLHELLKDFPDFSIDAQGKLRDRADNLALEIAMSYRIDAIEIFSKYK